MKGKRICHKRCLCKKQDYRCYQVRSRTSLSLLLLVINSTRISSITAITTSISSITARTRAKKLQQLLDVVVSDAQAAKLVIMPREPLGHYDHKRQGTLPTQHNTNNCQLVLVSVPISRTMSTVVWPSCTHCRFGHSLYYSMYTYCSLQWLQPNGFWCTSLIFNLVLSSSKTSLLQAILLPTGSAILPEGFLLSFFSCSLMKKKTFLFLVISFCTSCTCALFHEAP